MRVKPVPWEEETTARLQASSNIADLTSWLMPSSSNVRGQATSETKKAFRYMDPVFDPMLQKPRPWECTHGVPRVIFRCCKQIQHCCYYVHFMERFILCASNAILQRFMFDKPCQAWLYVVSYLVLSILIDAFSKHCKSSLHSASCGPACSAIEQSETIVSSAHRRLQIFDQVVSLAILGVPGEVAKVNGMHRFAGSWRAWLAAFGLLVVGFRILGGLWFAFVSMLHRC